MTFHSVGNVIIPTDELHDFSEGWLNHQPASVQLVCIRPWRTGRSRTTDAIAGVVGQRKGAVDLC